MNSAEKHQILRDVVKSLSQEREVRRIMVFGSFLRSESPQDVAVFQDSSEPYLPLALKYRSRTRHIARRIPIDIIPVRPNAHACSFLSEIESGVSQEDCDLLDSIYLSSKHPAAGALPDYEPDEGICGKGLEIARRVRMTAGKQL